MLDRADSPGIQAGAPPSVSPLPAWARAKNPPETEAEAAFLAGAALARLDAVVRADPPWFGVWRQRLGGAFDLGAPSDRSCRRQRARGLQPTSSGSGVGAGPGQVEGVAQRRFVLTPSGARHAGGGGLERQAATPDAGPGRREAQESVERAEPSAGKEGGLGFSLGGMVRARPSRKRWRRGKRNILDSWRINAIEHAGRLAHRGASGYLCAP